MGRKYSATASRAAALAVVKRLRESGHVAYFAGGCVRDELLGLAPTDYDVATDAAPDRIRGLFGRTNEVGEAFGVVLVTPTAAEGAPEPATVEVATFRSDGTYSDCRRPDSVTFSDARSDAMRRDFTVNALFLDPLGSPEAGIAGAVIDFVNGRADLAARLIRAVGDPDARLAEDHLRALRAVRLGARLRFKIDPGTASAIKRHAADLLGLSRERIGEELHRMMVHPARAEAVRLLEELELDAPVLEEPHRQRSGSSLEVLPDDASYPTCLAAWAMDRGLTLEESEIRSVVRRWRSALCLSNDDRDLVLHVLQALRSLERDWGSLGVAGRKRLAGLHPGYSGAFDVFRGRYPADAERVRRDAEVLAATSSGLCPEPLVTGDELIAAGFRPGPAFKRLLDQLYDAQLEDRVKSVSEGLELARRLGV